MTRFVNKFRNSLPSLREAVEGNQDLRKNQKLYKKIYKFYKDQGAIFTGESRIDYEMILDYIYEDIYS